MPPLKFIQAAETYDAVTTYLGQASEIQRSKIDNRGYLYIWNKGKSGYIGIYFVDGGGILVRGGIFAYGVDGKEMEQWKRFMRGEGPAPCAVTGAEQDAATGDIHGLGVEKQGRTRALHVTGHANSGFAALRFLPREPARERVVRPQVVALVVELLSL